MTLVESGSTSGMEIRKPVEATMFAHQRIAFLLLPGNQEQQKHPDRGE